MKLPQATIKVEKNKLR